MSARVDHRGEGEELDKTGGPLDDKSQGGGAGSMGGGTSDRDAEIKALAEAAKAKGARRARTGPASPGRRSSSVGDSARIDAAAAPAVSLDDVRRAVSDRVGLRITAYRNLGLALTGHEHWAIDKAAISARADAIASGVLTGDDAKRVIDALDAWRKVDLILGVLEVAALPAIKSMKLYREQRAARAASTPGSDAPKETDAK